MAENVYIVLLFSLRVLHVSKEYIARIRAL
jgi:hypothetical protein